MKKIATLLITLTVAIACQPNPDSLEAKQKALKEKQSDLSKLKAEIKTLEQELEKLDTTEVVIEKTPVKATVLKPKHFDHFIDLTGTVTSKENVMISSKAMGQVTAIPAIEGQKVAKGTVLVRLENDAVRNQLEEVQSSYDLAKLTFEKRERLWKKNIGSEIEYLQAKNTYQTTKNKLGQVQAQYDNTIIESPINGTVDAVQVNEGEYVNMGTPIVRVVDLENVEIEAELSEEYLSNVNKGDTVTVSIASLGITQKVPITFVGQVINPANRSFAVKVSLKNKDKRIKPNVLANLMIRDYTTDNALVVPSIAINRDLKGEFVYVVATEDGGKVAKKKYVKKGKTFNDMTEIAKGVLEGDEVVTSGFNQISQGEPIEVRK